MVVMSRYFRCIAVHASLFPRKLADRRNRALTRVKRKQIRDRRVFRFRGGGLSGSLSWRVSKLECMLTPINFSSGRTWHVFS